MSERYRFASTAFSPSGTLNQVDYALAAVSAGGPSIGIIYSKGVVIATEKNYKSIQYDEHSVKKIKSISPHIGMIYSGMGPDYDVLVKRARNKVQEYSLMYGGPMPTSQLAQEIANAMQKFTQSGGVRPFGISLLIAGYDVHHDRPCLYQCDPSGENSAWKATAIGKNSMNSKASLESQYFDGLELEDAVHTALVTLKGSFEGQMTGDNIEIGICSKAGFKTLTPEEIGDYLTY